jgi:ATP-dependent DNA helicase DinG
MKTLKTITDATQAKSHFSKFRDNPFRKYQAETILFTLESEKKFTVVEAPTGSGKSLIGMVAGAMEKGVTYLVHSKVLQNQLLQDFPEAVVLFGRANYPCLLWEKEGLDCGMCTHQPPSAICPYAPKKGVASKCLYEMAKHAALASRYRVLNYDYFITEANFVGRFSDQDFVVCDEADSFEDILVDFVSLTFSWKLLKEIGVDSEPLRKTPDSKLGIEPWMEFAREILHKANRHKKMLTGRFDQMPSGPELYKMKRRIQRMDTLMTKTRIFIDNVDDTWLYDDRNENNITFRPIWMTEILAEQFMWRHSERFLVMSAIFPPNAILSATLGIPTEDIEKVRVKSTFPIENRSIHMMNTAKLTNKTMEEEIPKIIAAIDGIMEAHAEEKGLIHAVSYKLGRAIIDGCKYKSRFITHNGENRQDKVDEFRESDMPLVMVSPSLDRGVSLDGDLCRFIIIAKAPFLYLADKVTNARIYGSKLGQLWYATNMLLTVLQMSGRGMRSESDRCATYVLDSNVDRAINEIPSVLPEWWIDAVVDEW